MPNHLHGIIRIQNSEKALIDDVKNGGITGENNPMFYQSISKIIRWYKGRCTFEINKEQDDVFFAWQPRFYDHIIGNKDDLRRIREYIQNNPANWPDDDLYETKTKP